MDENKCYFCSGEARVNSDPCDKDKVVGCATCGSYRITYESFRYDYPNLTDEEKIKVSNYLEKEKDKDYTIKIIPNSTNYYDLNLQSGEYYKINLHQILS